MRIVDMAGNNVLSVLYGRLREEPVAASVPGSLPVLFFGNLFSAGTATVGLNPSHQEYLDTKGQELTGDKRRFETLTSLGAADRRSLSDAQCERAVATMRSYYIPGKPVYRWFRPLSTVVASMGLSYSRGEVVHLDLVQESTRPTWSALSKVSPGDFRRLRDAGLPFLRWQLESFPLGCVLCNGRTVFETVRETLGATVRQNGVLKRVRWCHACTQVNDRHVDVFGWNIPLTRPTGLGSAGEADLGRICLRLCEHLR